MNRRTYLAAAGGSALGVALAGCADLGSDETDGDDPNGDSDDDGGDGGDEGPDHPDVVGTFDDFEDLDAWEVVAGTATADGSRSVEGSQSARLEIAAEETQTRLVRDLEEPIDCTEASPGLAAAAEQKERPMIQLLDDDGGRLEFRSSIEGGVEMRPCNFGIQNADGDVDPSRITEIQIAFYAGEEAEGTLWIDDLHFVPRPTDGKVMIQFDGGHERQYTEGLAVLEEYDYPATAFVPTARIRADEDGDSSRLTEAQLEELHDAGWTIASNTATSSIPSRLEDDELDDQIVDAREWLEEHGYEEGARYFSAPTGRYDDRTLELIDETHELGFAGDYAATGYAADPLRCQRVVGPDAETAGDLLELTATYGGITSLCYFDLEEGSLEAFATAMAVIDDLDLDVITPREFESAYVHRRD